MSQPWWAGGQGVGGDGGPVGTPQLYGSGVPVEAPQAVWGSRNQFPEMPSTSQRHFFTDPDADINMVGPWELQTGAESADHFAYGGPNRLGTQSAYLAVPHHCSSPCPSVRLPAANPRCFASTGGMFDLAHPHLKVNELAFTVKLRGEVKIPSPASGYLLCAKLTPNSTGQSLAGVPGSCRATGRRW